MSRTPKVTTTKKKIDINDSHLTTEVNGESNKKEKFHSTIKKNPTKKVIDNLEGEKKEDVKKDHTLNGTFKKPVSIVKKITKPAADKTEDAEKEKNTTGSKLRKPITPGVNKIKPKEKKEQIEGEGADKDEKSENKSPAKRITLKKESTDKDASKKHDLKISKVTKPNGKAESEDKTAKDKEENKRLATSKKVTITPVKNLKKDITNGKTDEKEETAGKIKGKTPVKPIIPSPTKKNGKDVKDTKKASIKVDKEEITDVAAEVTNTVEDVVENKEEVAEVIANTEVIENAKNVEVDHEIKEVVEHKEEPIVENTNEINIETAIDNNLNAESTLATTTNVEETVTSA
jgi:hypothetical protein